jgi:hypothetical protein
MSPDGQIVLDMVVFCFELPGNTIIIKEASDIHLREIYIGRQGQDFSNQVRRLNRDQFLAGSNSRWMAAAGGCQSYTVIIAVNRWTGHPSSTPFVSYAKRIVKVLGIHIKLTGTSADGQQSS